MIQGIGDFNKKKKLPPLEYETWKGNPSSENHNNLMKSLDPIISSALMSFTGGDKTLRTRARILADKALLTYDPERGASLKSHVYNNLQRLQRYSAQRQRALHVPENVRFDSQVIRRFKDEYRDKYGDDPTDDTVADRLGMSRRRVRKAGGTGELSEGQSLGEIGDLQGTISKTPDQVWMDYVYHDLGDTNKKILGWTSGYRGSEILLKKEIARRLGITPAAVSSRVSTITRRLEEGQE